MSSSGLKPDASGGIHSGLPDTHSIVTRSPESIVSTGGKPPSKKPQCTVSGSDCRKCVLPTVSVAPIALFISMSFLSGRNGASGDEARLHVETIVRDIARAGEPDAV